MTTEEVTKTIKQLEMNTNRRANEVFVGNYKSSFRGQGLEVSDLRKYEEGDDVRHIDWLITARQGKPYVKKFQETRELITILLINVSGSMDFSTAPKTKNYIALETSALLLFSALKNNDKFGVIIFADKIIKYIPPQKGRRHLLHILRDIIQAQQDYKNKSTNLTGALDYINRTLKKQALCFLLTDNLLDSLDSKNNLMSLKIANKKNDLVYVNIFDNFEKKIEKTNFKLKIINQETGNEYIVNLSDKKVISKYNSLREKKNKQEKEILKKNQIDSLRISTKDNVYKNLLLFFKKRALKY